MADAVFADVFVTDIQDHMGILLLQPAGHEACRLGNQLLIDLADSAGAELLSAEFLGDRLNPRMRQSCVRNTSPGKNLAA